MPRATLRAALRAEVAPMFQELRGFLDRRIAELSAEVSATSDMADMAEENISRRIAEVHAQIAQLVAIPAASTRNSGLELEAVVQATEAAANTILEATEAIQGWISRGDKDEASIEALSLRVNAIFEACSFQDVTGQRIRRAIQHLQQVESMLEGIAPGAAPPAPPAVRVATQMRTVTAGALSAPDLGQAEIDALLGGGAPAPAATPSGAISPGAISPGAMSPGAMSQAEIDALLGG